MEVQFWGVRGSIAVSGSKYQRYGGNTTCVEVTHDGQRLILDAGTGARALGDAIGFSPVSATFLFTHVHWDHIQGFPFFAPAFHPGSDLRILGADRPSGGVADALRAQMRPPQFPVTLDALRARLSFGGVTSGEWVEIGPFRVLPLELDHPDGVLAYRIEAGGKTVVFATDVEQALRGGAEGGAGLDRRLIALAEGADLLIHDAQYTPAEYVGQSGPMRRGWGHSTWTAAMAIAREAAAARLALYHHDPSRTDDQLDAIEQVARLDLAGVFMAREGAPVAV
jgi:phosphoribosyl 1,2-cyclic phosphodiesterase